MEIRSFIAFPLSEQMAEPFFETAEMLCNMDNFQQIRWLPPENCHMTLAFLGNVHKNRFYHLIQNLSQNLSEQNDGILQFNEVSPFPFHKRPRGIAALAEANSWLKALQSQCMQAARKSGIELERRLFVPHVTLARIKKRKKNSQGFPPLFVNVQIPVKKIVLYESILHPEGAQYHVIESFDLNVEEE